MKAGSIVYGIFKNAYKYGVGNLRKIDTFTIGNNKRSRDNDTYDGFIFNNIAIVKKHFIHSGYDEDHLYINIYKSDIIMNVLEDAHLTVYETCGQTIDDSRWVVSGEWVDYIEKYIDKIEDQVNDAKTTEYLKELEKQNERNREFIEAFKIYNL